MAVFEYEAITPSGSKVRRSVEADNQQDALKKIRGQGMRPTKMKEKKGAAGIAGAGGDIEKKKFRIGAIFDRIKQQDIVQFTQQMATLQDAGLPIVRSLKILSGQMRQGRFRSQLEKVTDDVESGSTFSEALAKFPRTFNNLFVAMIKAGEAGGVLDLILQRLSDFQEKSMKLRKKVKGAMVYPIAVICVAAGILGFIMTTVIPQFQKMFDDMGTTLPAPTQALLAFSNAISTYWYLAPLVVFGVVGLIKALARTEKGGLALDRFKLTAPIFGQIVKKSTISRFCRTLGTLISSGVPILEALDIVRQAVGNKVIANAISDVHGSIREGETIAEPLGQSGVFDPLLVNMIDVGEETGELDKMLSKIADNYDLDVDVLVDSLSSLLEPVLIVGMGIAVGFIVIALFMPLLSIITSI
ncbi:MAG TPA: type II secretion system F family protein [Planctomycetes bacterium]|nr:type II secretion system F family protein [Planctomycetota bacterium]HIN81026.1 type II secretion system F family protein [Planctomycetota bacterium]